MKTQTGAWLDKEKDLIIKLSEGKHTIKTIESNFSIRERIPGESKKKNRIKKQKTKYLKKIIREIENSDEIVLFGPAEMKTYLKKMILKNNKICSKSLALKSADSMTENQLVAWVKEYYNKKTPAKSK